MDAADFGLFRRKRNVSLLEQDVGLFGFFRRSSSPTTKDLPLLLKSSVSSDDESITCHRDGFNGLVESVRWLDLRTVLIRTTDRGPFVDDVFWVLWTEDSECMTPSEAEGMSQLLERLQTLPNFDNSAIIEAMQSTENRWFVCWKHPDANLRQRIRWNFFKTPWREVVWSLNQKTT